MTFFEEVQDVVKNRLINPITGTFTLAWLICNWRFVLTLFFGNDNINIRIRLLEKYINLDDMLFTPIIYTLIYIFILPQVTYFIRFYNSQINSKAERMEAFFIGKKFSETDNRSYSHEFERKDDVVSHTVIPRDQSKVKIILTDNEKDDIIEKVLSEIEPYIERKLNQFTNNKYKS